MQPFIFPTVLLLVLSWAINFPPDKRALSEADLTTSGPAGLHLSVSGLALLVSFQPLTNQNTFNTAVNFLRNHALFLVCKKLVNVYKIANS